MVLPGPVRSFRVVPSTRRSFTSPALSSSPKLSYYSAWFCPFAHRCTLALEHHAEAVPYTWNEALGWEKRPPTGNENFDAADRKDWWYHWKSPELLAANPLGMVPTLVEQGTSGRAVTESLVCIEFVDELAAHAGTTSAPLLPPDPYERAAARVAADRVNKIVCSAYYEVLVREDPGEREAGFAKLIGGLKDFAKTGLANAAARSAQGLPDVGPFWDGRQSLGLVDCVLLPYAYRLYVLEHYRGPSFALPPPRETSVDEEEWAWYATWLKSAVALDYVSRTLPEKGRYLEHVKKYAEGRARSKVGNAVRRGASAHAYDDKVDG